MDRLTWVETMAKNSHVPDNALRPVSSSDAVIQRRVRFRSQPDPHLTRIFELRRAIRDRIFTELGSAPPNRDIVTLLSNTFFPRPTRAGERCCMKKTRLRAALSIFGMLIAAGVAGLVLNESLWPDQSFEGQIRKLESSRSSRRRAAATELGRFNDAADKVVPALVKALGDSDTEVRLNALESLKAFGQKAKPAATMARQILERDPEANLRKRAAALLGAMKDQNEIPTLIKALDDPDPAVRLEATRSFGWFSPGSASKPLVDKLLLGLGSDYPVEVREATIESLASVARDRERVARAIADVSAKDPSPQIRARRWRA